MKARHFATCPLGLEYLLRDELRALGLADAREGLAGVRFEGSDVDGLRACLWSRLASRVLRIIAEFDVDDADSLYAGVDAIDWSEHLDPERSFAIDANGSSAALRHTQFIAQKAKDAIVDQFRRRHGQRPDVDAERPDLRISIRLHRGRASVAIDLSGEPLHRRGWRAEQGRAPLKENLAAALLMRSGWPDIAAQGGVLVDPFCGAGTLPIEAAWMAADVAPGLLRTRWGFQGWRPHDPAQWTALIDEAKARAEAGTATLCAGFFGYDIDPRMIAMARANAEAAGVGDALKFEVRAVDALLPPADVSRGLVIANPPYGERLGEAAELGALYREFGQRLREGFSAWKAGVLVADNELGHRLGLRANRTYALHNGAIECQLLVFDPVGLPSVERKPLAPLSDGAQAVVNRLTKNLRHLRKRLDREGVSCYRIYDADLPEYAAAIDVYTAIAREDADGHLDANGGPQRWLHVQEYAPPKTIAEDLARTRLRELVRAAGEALEVPQARIAQKTRQRGKGGSKYVRFDGRGEFLVVEEAGLNFRVNLFDYLDTGLFLDHRPTRARLRTLARGQRMLNLFCYTAAASVHAAAGGARSTTSVDLSATYLDWAARNFALNGLSGHAHRFLQADVMEWLRHERGEYDLVFVDPPSFSNSARAADFDVQRDHAELLRRCATRLASSGLIVFSNNLRRFELDAQLAEQFHIDVRSTATIPFDFERNPRIHRVFELRKR